MAKRALTEKQQKFLDVLFEEAQGSPLEAKKLAGYSPNVPTSAVTASLEDEIIDLTRKYMATNMSKAAFALVDIIDQPVKLGNKERMAAAKDILDRGGLSKTEKVEVSGSGSLFILPPKEGNSEENESS